MERLFRETTRDLQSLTTPPSSRRSASPCVHGTRSQPFHKRFIDLHTDMCFTPFNRGGLTAVVFGPGTKNSGRETEV
jgi:hypothetical protein